MPLSHKGLKCAGAFNILEYRSLEGISISREGDAQDGAWFYVYNQSQSPPEPTPKTTGF